MCSLQYFSILPKTPCLGFAKCSSAFLLVLSKEKKTLDKEKQLEQWVWMLVDSKIYVLNMAHDKVLFCCVFFLADRQWQKPYFVVCFFLRKAK